MNTMHTRSTHRIGLLLTVAAALLAPVRAAAQDAPDPATDASNQTDVAADVADAAEPGMVALNLPEDVPIEVLVDYVAKRRDVNFIYDRSALANKTVTIKTRRRIPADALMTLLESALKMRGLAISETDIDGMLRIEPDNRSLTLRSEGLGEAPEDGQAGDDAAGGDALPTRAVTRVFVLKHAPAQQVQQVLQPFLSANSADLTPLPDQNLLIVTDYAPNLPRLERLRDLVDQPGRAVNIRFVDLEHIEAKPAAEKIREVRKGMTEATGDKAAPPLLVQPDERTNRLALVGVEAAIDEALALIADFDVSLGMVTEIYEFDVASPEQIDRLVTETLGESKVDRLYRSAIDENANLMIVTTTDAIHQQVRALKDRIDQPLTEAQNPIRFYKLENAKAADVLQTLQSITGEEGLGGVTVDGVSTRPERADATADGRGGEDGDELTLRGPTEQEVNRGRAEEAESDRPGPVDVGDARVMADEATNTIIIVAPSTMHPVYEKLIQRLDVRRPQVLVEATVVSIDTSDNFELGVQLASGEEADGGTLLNFTQFGLTTEDSQPGSITLQPGTGFTGALLDADIAEVVIRALQSDSRARIVSRPTVLINDNATGTLSSEQEEPFESVNASDTVSTTTFGGFAAAGTTLEITPQISEGDHLKLEYAITLSSFGDERINNLPPSRSTDELISEATIPDGHTIVVGGLTRENFSENVSRVPLLGELPILEYLFSNRTRTDDQTTLFVFIHATILRDDEFADLKLLSGDALGRAGVPDNFPDSQPLTIP